MKTLFLYILLAVAAFAQPFPGDRLTHDAGKIVTLTVSAEGTAPFTYKWFRNGWPLPQSGSTATIALDRPEERLIHPTFEYWCVVTNSEGSATSPKAYIKAIKPPPTPEEIEAERLRLEALRIAEELRLLKLKEQEAATAAEVTYSPDTRDFGPMPAAKVHELAEQLAERGL